MPSRNLLKIKRTEFDNGLVLLTEQFPEKQKVALLVGIGVGGINEDSALSDGSHFNEHMLFKSNKFRTTNQICEDLEYDGTSINASTSFTRTTVYAKAIPEKLGKSIEIAYQASTNFDYNIEEFESERGVILTEIQKYIDEPSYYLSYNLFLPTLFKNTLFEKSVAGTQTSMGNIKKEELEQFKKRYYVPNNMVIVACGNFNEEALSKEVGNTFGKLAPKKFKKIDLEINLENRKNKKIEKRGGLKQIYLALGYKVPGNAHEDIHKLSILKSLLSDGLSSRLFKKLRHERGIGYNIEADYYCLGRNTGYFFVDVEGFDPDRFNETKDVILGEFNELKTKPVNDREFDGRKMYLISKIRDALESITWRAASILHTEFDNLPYDFREVEAHLKQVTKEDVMEVANKYLTDKYTLTALVPERFKK